MFEHQWAICLGSFAGACMMLVSDKVPNCVPLILHGDGAPILRALQAQLHNDITNSENDSKRNQAHIKKALNRSSNDVF